MNMQVSVKKLVKGAQGYERKNVTKNVLIAVDEVQRVVKSLDEALRERSVRHYASVLRPIGKTRWAHDAES